MDVVDVALLVTGALERCGVGYFLGGSLASSFQGEPRATNDIDLVVDLHPSHVEPVAAALGPDFEVDQPALRQATRDRGAWNIFYLPAVTKIDLFILRDEPFDRSEFSRRQRVEVRPGQAIFVKAPEDSVLRKLLWFEAGGGVSDRQWRDVVQILRQSRPVMRGDYLDAWAAALGVTGLLQRARGEAGSSP